VERHGEWQRAAQEPFGARESRLPAPAVLA
jgi:hypothetical protein